jgi:hypothetical protein
MINIQTRILAGHRGFKSRQVRIFLFAMDSILTVGVCVTSAKLTTYLHLVPRLIICGIIPPLLYTSAWLLA